MHAPTVKLVHNNYNTRICNRSKTHSETSTKTIGANFRLGRVILVAVALIVIGDGDSSVVRAPDSRLKGPGFKSL